MPTYLCKELLGRYPGRYAKLSLHETPATAADGFLAESPPSPAGLSGGRRRPARRTSTAEWRGRLMPPVAVITGGSSGIGAATAVKLAEAGYRVILAARRAGRISELAGQ